MSELAPLPAERAGQPLPPDLAAMREQMLAQRDSGFYRTELAPAEITLGRRRALLLTAGLPRARVFHLHGGGFRNGVPEMEAPYAERLLRAAPVEVVLPEYGLASEHPFPTGLVDAWAALEDYAAQDPELPLIVSGQSAGGGLAASLAVMAADRGLQIAGLVLIAPWLDLTVSAPSYEANRASDPLFSAESAARAAGLYLQGADPRHPLASPLFAPVAGLPPTLVAVGSGEVLSDDATRFHKRLQHAGVSSELLAVDGMEHVAVTRDPQGVGAPETFARIARFVNDVLA
jgi:acetyl esterase/lipase